MKNTYGYHLTLMDGVQVYSCSGGPQKLNNKCLYRGEIE